MAFLFKSIATAGASSRQKPSEIAKALKENLSKLDEAFQLNASNEVISKISEENSKIILQIKMILFGEESNIGNGSGASSISFSQQPSNSEASQQMCNEFYMNDLFFCLISSLDKINFETRKEIVAIAIGLLKRQTGSRFSTVDFLSSHFYIVEHLYNAYQREEIALNCGMILRELLKFDILLEMLFSMNWYWNIFKYAQLPEFHLSSDAFATLRESLIRSFSLSSAFIRDNYHKFVEHLNELLQSDNYVLKRQTLKLIGELLAEKSCFEFANAYLSSVENLKISMNFMLDKSKNIAMEAYCLFKLFVMNHARSPAISGILLKNREKLVAFLEAFSLEKAEDEEFVKENAKCIQAINEIQTQIHEQQQPSSTTTSIEKPLQE